MDLENYHVFGELLVHFEFLGKETKSFLKSLPENSKNFYETRFWAHSNERREGEDRSAHINRLYKEAKEKFAKAVEGEYGESLVYVTLTAREALLLAINCQAKRGHANVAKESLIWGALGEMFKGVNRSALGIYTALSEREKKTFINRYDCWLRQSFYFNAVQYDGIMTYEKIKFCKRPDEIFHKRHKNWGFGR